IVSPVMRVIGVTDAARSAAFYTGILGFENHQDEVASGPARVRFAPPGSAAPGSAQLFFETADVVAAHAAVRERGGHPSEIDKVNWIKMQMFAIRDPDGHTLWFGQSYHRDHPDGTRGLCEKAIPHLPVNDVASASQHYRQMLGFRRNYEQEDLAVLD